jgi:glycine/D-amino acid oxidase-like deaminating enzyme
MSNNRFQGTAPLSIWEKESFFAPSDFLLIGSGFVGLWSAYFLKKRFPKKKVTILERGLIPTGASTRNAGFACFGSISEVLYDARTMGLDKTLELVELRYRGIKRIDKTFRKKDILLEYSGGYDLLTAKELESLPDLKEEIKWINKELEELIGEKKVYSLQPGKIGEFELSGVETLVENRMEGGLHSGKLAEQLLSLVQGMGVTILNNIEVQQLEKGPEGFEVHSGQGLVFKASRVLVCTNAFARQLLPELAVEPARGQVILTSPVEDLKLKGTFHYDEGFYYFRNLGNRVLLGGARNKAFEEEKTVDMNTSEIIQQELERFLSTHILPGKEYTITDRWSGIMAMGPEKTPMIKEVQPDLFCAVRMSGMGVALAPVIGEMVAEIMHR